MQLLVNILCLLIPASLLLPIVQRVTNQSPHAAQVTMAFLQSRGGVRQALFVNLQQSIVAAGDD